MPDPIAVKTMFGRIAHRYDLTNKVLSVGIDVYWRFCLVSRVRRTHPRAILDLATGSGDVAFALKKALAVETTVLGMDFCEPMICEANAKKLGRPKIGAGLEFNQGDALALPLPDASFDAVTMAFGFRNMADRARCLSEIRRVLRTDGHLFILEFSKPWRWLRPIYDFHLKHIVPFVAARLTGDRSAYEYLCSSIGGFPDRDALSGEIRSAGFADVAAFPLTAGIVAIHTARRHTTVN
jgi:demethylmenaquinone methyltransferase/2-methoxy-6-polyprenyl-1,4-benzoquinol methylase